MFICGTWLIHMWDMTHSHVGHDSFIHVEGLFVCSVTHLYVGHDPFKCVTWLIHRCDMTPSCVWHDSFTCAAWHYSCVCVCVCVCVYVCIYDTTGSRAGASDHILESHSIVIWHGKYATALTFQNFRSTRYTFSHVVARSWFDNVWLCKSLLRRDVTVCDCVIWQNVMWFDKMLCDLTKCYVIWQNVTIEGCFTMNVTMYNEGTWQSDTMWWDNVLRCNNA